MKLMMYRLWGFSIGWFFFTMIYDLSIEQKIISSLLFAYFIVFGDIHFKIKEEM